MSTSRKNRLPLFAALFALAATTLPLRAEGPDIKAKIISPASVAAGKSGTVVVEMTLGAKWHVNSHTPTESYLIPTNVALTASAGKLSAVRYPKQVMKKLAFAETPMAVYEGTVRFEADLELPKNAAGKVTLGGTLSYQACNDQQCFPPTKIPLEGSVTVGK